MPGDAPELNQRTTGGLARQEDMMATRHEELTGAASAHIGLDAPPLQRERLVKVHDTTPHGYPHDADTTSPDHDASQARRRSGET